MGGASETALRLSYARTTAAKTWRPEGLPAPPPTDWLGTADERTANANLSTAPAAVRGACVVAAGAVIADLPVVVTAAPICGANDASRTFGFVPAAGVAALMAGLT